MPYANIISLSLVLLLPVSGLSSESEDILQDLYQAEYGNLLRRMSSARGADSLFLAAIFEADGAKAAKMFYTIYDQYRNHPLVWESLQRLYEYNTAIPDFAEAEIYKKELQSRPPETNPQSQKPKSCIYWVQAGAFSSQSNALKLKKKLTALGYAVEIIDSVVEGKKLKVVRAGKYSSQAEAEQASKNIAKKLKITPRVVEEEL